MLIFRKLLATRYFLAFVSSAFLLALRFYSLPDHASCRTLCGMGSLSLVGPLVPRRKTKSRGAKRDASAEIAATLRQGRVFQQISETLPDLLYIYDLAEQRNVYVNREVGTMLGYTAEEIRGMGSDLLVRLIHPDDLPRIEESHRQIAALEEGETTETEYRIRRKDGVWRWLCSRESVFMRDSAGRPTQKLGIAQDVTERKNAQEAIQWQAALLRHTTDAATLGFYVADSETDAALYYNARFLELWNLTDFAPHLEANALTHSEVMRRCLPQIESPDGSAAEWEPMRGAADSDAMAEEIRLTGGRVLRRFSTQINGETTACFGRFYWFEDITAQRLLEEQLETQLTHIQDTNAQLEMQAQMLNQANAQLERLATTDGLTGLQNNRAFPGLSVADTGPFQTWRGQRAFADFAGRRPLQTI